MTRWVRAILTPPRFEDEDRQRSAYVVNVALITLVVASLAAIPIAALSRDVTSSVGTSVALALLLGCLSVFRRRRNLIFPSVVIPLIVITLTTYLIVVGLGIHDITILMYPVAIIIGGLLLGIRGTVAFAALSATALTAVFFADRGGLIAESIAAETQVEDLAFLVFFMVLIAAVMILNQGLVIRSLERIRSSERNLKSAQEIAHLGSWRRQFAENRVRWSDEMYRILGFAPGEVQSSLESFLERIHPEDRELAQHSAKAVLDARQRSAELAIRVLRPSGEQRHVELYTEVVVDENRSPTELIGVLHDVTERIEAKQETELLQEQLAQAQRMEAIGMLAGGVAHDFNNILTTIVGNCDLLALEKGLSASMQEGIQEIQNAAYRATSLTHQLLAFSRKQVLQPEVLDLNALITRFETILRRLISEDISLSLALDPTIGRVMADPSQLEQVILNLSVNARDAMEPGGVLSIETQSFHLDELYAENHPDVEPGEYVLLAVSDTGIGFDEETRTKLFDPFFTTKDRGRGTGLGLATVYGIVKQSGGHIWVYSELDHGTSFKVYLPEVRDEVDETPQAEHSREAFTGTESILLVEDDESVRSMLAFSLRRLGYTVHEAGDSEEALELADQQNLEDVDILVTDVILPGGSGVDLVRAIRRRRASIAVLFISGYTDNAIEQRGILDKSLHFLQKPFSPSTLAEKVREIIDGRSNT